MDMITSMEIDDALKNKEKVEARVREVALKVAEIQGEIDNASPRKWTITRWHINMSNRGHDPAYAERTEVTVDLGIDWEDRPVTAKWGDPSDDDTSEHYRMSHDDTILRRIWFPRRYLLTDGWDQEVIDLYAAVKIRRDEMDVESLDKALKEARDRVKKLYDERTSKAKKLAESKAAVKLGA